MKFFQIGDRIINCEHITHVCYVPDGLNGIELIVSFGCDECSLFYGSEAQDLWARLSYMSLKVLPTSESNRGNAFVTDYLDQCARLHGPDEPLLNGLAKTYCGTDFDHHARWLRDALIAAVARAFKPGCEVTRICILTGEAGVGKSAFWQILGGQWFHSISQAPTRDELLELHQAWIVEWEGIDQPFHSALTLGTDQLRPRFGVTTQPFDRPFIFVGTTNRDTIGTGFIPVVQPIDLERLATERDRIWAAATHAYKAHSGSPEQLTSLA